MINPKMHKQGSPEWVLAKFLEAWKRRSWKQMVDYVRIIPVFDTISSTSAMSEPHEALKARFNPELIDARLIQANARTPAVTEYLVEIEYKASSVAQKKVVSKIRLYSKLTEHIVEAVWEVDPTTIVLEIEPIRKAEPKPVADKTQVEEETASVESHEDEPEDELKKVEKRGKKVSKEPEPEA